MILELKKPTPSDELPIYDLLDLWLKEEQTNVIAGSFGLSQMSFKSWLRLCNSGIANNILFDEFLIKLNDAPIGFANVRYTYTASSWIDGHFDIGLIPQHRQKGICTALFKEIKSLWKQHGLTFAYCICPLSNSGANRLLLSCGGQYMRKVLLLNGEWANTYKIKVWTGVKDKCKI